MLTLWTGAATCQIDGILRYFGYGYQAWLLPGSGRMFALRGFRGQEMFVDPRSKTVMVATAVWPVGRGGREVIALWQGVLASLR
jgi:hypothetical protein